MANITKVATPKPNELSPVITFATLAAGDTIDCDYKDERTIILFNTSTAGKVVIEAGNGYAGGADLELNLSAGYQAVTFDSARYKQVYGTNAGKIVIKSKTATATYAVIEATV